MCGDRPHTHTHRHTQRENQHEGSRSRSRGRDRGEAKHSTREDMEGGSSRRIQVFIALANIIAAVRRRRRIEKKTRVEGGRGDDGGEVGSGERASLLVTSEVYTHTHTQKREEREEEGRRWAVM